MCLFRIIDVSVSAKINSCSLIALKVCFARLHSFFLEPEPSLDCDICVAQFVRAIHARFHCASVGFPLRQRTKIHSPAHSSIGTPSPRRAPTPCRCMVSDLFHSPLRGSFHLSLTVLVHYRSLQIFSLTS